MDRKYRVSPEYMLPYEAEGPQNEAGFHEVHSAFVTIQFCGFLLSSNKMNMICPESVGIVAVDEDVRGERESP
jgi:hypothetical protein